MNYARRSKQYHFESFGEFVLMPLLGLTPTIWATGNNAYEHGK